MHDMPPNTLDAAGKLAKDAHLKDLELQAQLEVITEKEHSLELRALAHKRHQG